jgi:hypothetical protein
MCVFTSSQSTIFFNKVFIGNSRHPADLLHVYALSSASPSLPSTLILLKCIEKHILLPSVQFFIQQIMFAHNIVLMIDIILPAALWPGGWFSLNRNEYQGYFLRVKGGRCLGLKPCHLKCRLSWNLGVSTFWNPQSLLPRPVFGLLLLWAKLYLITLPY